ncbi:MAG: DMT family transporter [Pseudomonadota bacterium]
MKNREAIVAAGENPTAKPPRSAGQNVVFGMVLMTIGMLILPIMDALAKALSTWYDVTPGQITFSRFLVQSILLGVIVGSFMGWRKLIPTQLAGNLARGALIGLASLIFFTSVRYMPLADAIAVFFIEPLILVVLSGLVLKEEVGWRRRIAVVIGFLGAMLVVQPSYAVFGPVSLLPVLTAFLFATYLLLTRRLTSDDEPLTMQFMSGIGGTLTLAVVMVIGTVFGIADFAAPDVPEFGIRWVLLFSIGALAAFGHLLVTIAFRYAAASLLAPFQYVEIISATLFGYLMFGDFPNALKWLGISIIIGSGLYVFLRERKLARS